MKNYLFSLALMYSTISIGQDHNSDTSFVIDNQTFKIQTKEVNSDTVTLTIYRNSKIIEVDTLDAEGLSYLKFPDFDRDGNTDIMLTYVGNNFTYYLYLFDKTNMVFKFVDGFDKFPESQQLKANPKYYYSYHRPGCADMNWISDLFLIVNFKTIHFGQIYGKGCDADLKKDPQVIEIFKVFDKVEKNLIAKLPYQKNIPEFDAKWGFIKRYWEKNYSKFVQSKTTTANSEFGEMPASE